MDIAYYIGPAIRLLRERAGISQEELAARADLDRTYVSGVERSRRNPTVRSLISLADALNVGPEVFFIEARALMAEARRRLRTRLRGSGEGQSIKR